MKNPTTLLTARFKSLKLAPLHTRHALQLRLTHFLYTSGDHKHRTLDNIKLNDEIVLRLLQGLVVGRQDSPEVARRAVVGNFEDAEGAVEFDQLVEQGWVCKGWGVVSVSREVAEAAARSFPDGSPFLAWLKTRYETKIDWKEPLPADDELSTIVAEILEKGTFSGHLACLTPDWVAARAWDRNAYGPAEPAQRLQWWVERWYWLFTPTIIASSVWTEEQAESFMNAAITVVERETGLLRWPEYRFSILQRLARAADADTSHYQAYVSAVPSTIVDRALWIEGARIERARFDIDGASQYAASLIRLICYDVAERELPCDPSRVRRLLDFAVEHPLALGVVISCCQTHPRLLADLLMYPKTASLACMLIARWRGMSDAWERDLFDESSQRAVAEVFVDAVAMLEHWMHEETIPAIEIAALFRWMHAFVSEVKDSLAVTRERLLNRLRKMMSAQSLSVRESVWKALLENISEPATVNYQFVAAIDFLNGCQPEVIVDDGKRLVDAYREVLRSTTFDHVVRRITASAAAHLFRVAMETHSPSAFIAPFDLKADLAAARQEGESDFSRKYDLSRSLRCHIRVLARAVQGWQAEPPEVLVNGLRLALQSGAIDHAEKGRVHAFAARFESDMFAADGDRPLVSDVGAALGRLKPEDQGRLMSVILQTDEPAFLAQLISSCPPAFRDQVLKRIDELVPEEAVDVWSLPELQQRIQQLLSAGAIKAATRYMDLESEARTMGAVKGRELRRLQFMLQLALLKGDWTYFETVTVPDGLVHEEAHAADVTIRFYRALAEIRKSNGHPEYAVNILTELYERNPHVTGYGTNLLAAKLARLLERDAFRLLHGEDRAAGEQLLDEFDVLLANPTIGEQDWLTLTNNKAVLLLAMDRASDAYVLLSAIRQENETVNSSVYQAVAMMRLGKKQDALEIIAQAEAQFGDSELLHEVRSYISNAGDATVEITVATTVTDDQIGRLARAVRELETLDPALQAEVVNPGPAALERLLTTYVRHASAGISGAIPMLRKAKIANYENDITVLLRDLLGSRVAFLKWNVSDQPTGGYSAAGNPGSRDLVIKKDILEFTAIEAVVCKAKPSNSATRTRLRQHFQKLFSYSPSPILFHITYNFWTSTMDVISVLKKIAEKDSPPGCQYLRLEDWDWKDGGPRGFAGHYVRDGQETTVMFLVLDLDQSARRRAAAVAAT